MTERSGAAGLSGGGEVGDLIREKDWAATQLGPIAEWPPELRTNVQTILASPVPMVVIWGAEGILIYNQGYAEVCGPRHPAALGGRILEVWPEARAFNARVVAAGLAGEALSFHAQELELWRHGAPEQVWMDLEYLPIRDVAGTPIGTLAMVFDITDRIRAERRLAQSEGLFRFLDQLNQADDVLSVTTRMVASHLGLSNCAYANMDDDQDGFTIRGNWHAPGSPSIVGHYRLADFGTLAVQELGAGRPLIINDNLAEIAPHEAKTFQDIGIAATICMPLIKDGRLRALMAIHDRVPHYWSDYEQAVIREVTERSWAHVERVAAEVNLRASERQLRLAIDAAEIGLWDVDEVAGTLFWPPRVKAMFGISADVPVSMDDYYAGLHPDDHAATAAAYAAAADPDRRAIYDVEYRTIGKEDGVERWVAAKGRGVFEDGRCLRVIGTAIDITERKRTEQRLHDLNETLERRVAEGLAERKLLADVVDNTNALIFVTDPDYHWLAINRSAAEAFEAVYGRKAIVGESMLDELSDMPEHRDQVKQLWTRVLGGEEYTTTQEFGDPARERRCYEINFNVLRDAHGRQIGAYQIGQDVTERMEQQSRLVEAEEQLRQAQKMEALGQLTGGVAHDFNNLLTPIIGSLDLLNRKRLGTEREQRLVDGALQSAERARTLVQRLLAFARRQPLQPTAIDVGELARGMGELVASTTGPQVRVVIEAAPGLPAARADFNQLEMALLNLSVNARDAMRDGGTLRITAGVAVVEPGEGGDLRPGRYVSISVADTGTGMTPEVAERAVEPFFSTKGIGKGTGLGLSMVHGLTKQLGGGMRIFSREHVGTNVELLLPVADEPVRAQGDAPDTQPAHLGGTRGVVLLVDDEDTVRASTAHMLEEIGFQVVEAGSGEEGLAIVRARPDLSLLVTDHLMPGMDGTQFVRLAQSARPGLPCLIASGYAEVEGIAPDLPRLTKPFRAEELADAVADVMRTAPGAGRA